MPLRLLPPGIQERRKAASGMRMPTGWKKRGLLVDDYPLMLEYMKRVAEKFWVDITAVESCAEAKEEIANAEVPFDFAILDYRLTNGVGVEIYRKLALESPSTQVIFLTAYNTPELRKTVEEIGPARIISKNALMRPEFIGRLLIDLGAKTREAFPPMGKDWRGD